MSTLWPILCDEDQNQDDEDNDDDDENSWKLWLESFDDLFDFDINKRGRSVGRSVCQLV